MHCDHPPSSSLYCDEQLSLEGMNTWIEQPELDFGQQDLDSLSELESLREGCRILLPKSSEFGIPELAIEVWKNLRMLSEKSVPEWANMPSSQNVVAHAVALMDRLLSMPKGNTIDGKHHVLLGQTCLFVAAKISDVKKPKRADAFVTGTGTEKKLLCNMELFVLQRLNWCVSSVVTVHEALDFLFGLPWRDVGVKTFEGEALDSLGEKGLENFVKQFSMFLADVTPSQIENGSRSRLLFLPLAVLWWPEREWVSPRSGLMHCVF